MKVTFVGTGAGDWDPILKEKVGYRRNASLMIDDKLLIDAGPVIFAYGKEAFDNVEYILQTHSHTDHLKPETLQKLCQKGRKEFWCSPYVAGLVGNVHDLEIHTMPVFTPVQVGEYLVTALPANHDTWSKEEQPLHYIVEKDGVRMFYGCDGAWLRKETWRYLREFSFDFMILDGTLGDVSGDRRIFEHNCLPMVDLMVEVFRKQNVLKEGGRVMISHLSRGAHGTHEEVAERMSRTDVGVAYDGCVVEI
jgi:phosphoribosyl 1,2-cyclic phosphodiesterase